MLSSRYLHLHEALGLGPMWLNQAAKVRPATHQQPVSPAITPSGRSSTPPPLAERTLSPVAHHARIAAISTLQNKKASMPSEKPVATAATTTQAPDTTSPIERATAQTMPTQSVSDGIALPLPTDIMPSEIMVLSICPSTEDSMNGQLFSGDTGVLLDNMLAAIGLNPKHVHKTCWVKNAPIFNPKPEMAEIEAALPHICHELEQSQAKAVLLLGQIFEEAAQRQHIAALCQNIPYFIVPHPARLLRQPQLKAYAWQELKKLKRILQR